MHATASKGTKLLWKHLLMLLLLALLCRYGCPFFNLFGYRCPGCGLTRAWLCFLCGQWEEAISCHALFLPVPLYLFFIIHRGTPMLRNQRFLDPLLWLFTLMLVIYHLLRTQVLNF